jgi:NAD dependent epimerase/dehydratase family enzyme
MMSWIAIDDVLDILHRATWETEWEGPLNVTAPTPCTHREFYKMLARVLRRPCLFPVPDSVIRTVFGEMADQTILADLAVVPEQLEKLGYSFRHPDLTKTLSHLLGKQISRS